MLFKVIRDGNFQSFQRKSFKPEEGHVWLGIFRETTVIVLFLGWERSKKMFLLWEIWCLQEYLWASFFLSQKSNLTCRGEKLGAGSNKKHTWRFPNVGIYLNQKFSTWIFRMWGVRDFFFPYVISFSPKLPKIWWKCVCDLFSYDKSMGEDGIQDVFHHKKMEHGTLKNAWMSQEVCKWLVNGLQPTYKWGILGL